MMFRSCQLGWWHWQGKEGSVRNDVDREHLELTEGLDSLEIRGKEESDSSKIWALATGRTVELIRNAIGELFWWKVVVYTLIYFGFDSCNLSSRNVQEGNGCADL